MHPYSLLTLLSKNKYKWKGLVDQRGCVFLLNDQIQQLPKKLSLTLILLIEKQWLLFIVSFQFTFDVMITSTD